MFDIAHSFISKEDVSGKDRMNKFFANCVPKKGQFFKNSSLSIKFYIKQKINFCVSFFIGMKQKNTQVF